MSRSNGPLTRGGSHHQDWQHATEPDLPAQHASPHQPYQWPALNPQQASYGYQQTAHHQDYNGHSEPQPEAQFNSYHYPQDAAGHQPFSKPVPHPPFFGEQPAQHAPAQGQYAPRFENYLGGQQQNGSHYGHHQQTASEPDRQSYAPRLNSYDDQGLAQLQHPSQPRRMHTTLREQLQATQQNHWPAQDPREHDRRNHDLRNHDPRAHDPRDYDLGSYMPAGAPEQHGYGAAEPGLQNGQFDPHWQDPNAYGAQPGTPHASAADYYAQMGHEALPVAGQDQLDPDLDDDDDEYEETGRGRRGLLIVGALVSAILVGGGLAYGYKTIVGPGPKGTPPVIKADTRPAKSQPDDPGGKQFAHSDSKLMGRLEGDGGNDRDSSGGARASTLDDADSSGVRRVSTVIVSRDGSIAPPAEPRLPTTTVSVPGMMIVDGFGGRGPIMPSRGEPQPQAAAPAQPKIIAKAAPSAEPAAAPAAQPAPPPPALRTAAIEPEREPERAAAKQPAPRPPVTKAAATPAPAPKSNPVGYVAVLASQKSRIDALKTFADLQQKYIDVLQNKIPDVQEADLSARGLGTMYRVVVGPPSSREAAADLCGQLKSAGFQGCWVTAY